MTNTAKGILRQALDLSPVDRAQLIEELFRSFDPHDSAAIDAKWAAEAEARIAAYEAGKIPAVPVDEAFARIGLK